MARQSTIKMKWKEARHVQSSGLALLLVEPLRIEQAGEDRSDERKIHCFLKQYQKQKERFRSSSGYELATRLRAEDARVLHTTSNP